MPRRKSPSESDAGADTDLAAREYRDEHGNIHHHTRRTMARRAAEQPQGSGDRQEDAERDSRDADQPSRSRRRSTPARSKSASRGTSHRRRETRRDGESEGRSNQAEARDQHGRGHRGAGRWSNRTILLLTVAGVAALGLCAPGPLLNLSRNRGSRAMTGN